MQRPVKTAGGVHEDEYGTPVGESHSSNPPSDSGGALPNTSRWSSIPPVLMETLRRLTEQGR